MAEPAFDVEGVFNEDYLHFYAERTDEAHSEAEVDLVWRLLELEPGMEVLDLACGHGRIANRLAERGCRVTGLDTTPLFLDQARQDANARGVDVEYVHGDMREPPWTARFDRVINWFTSFGYFEDTDNQRVLAAVARALRPAGRFAIDVNNYAWLLRHYRSAHVVERDGDLLIDRSTLDPLTSRSLVQRITIRGGTRRDVHYFVRLFTFTELRDWLQVAGLSGVAGYDENGQQLSAESRRMIVIARR